MIYKKTYIDIAASVAKPLAWIGSSRSDLRKLPKQVRADFGKALYAAQCGTTDPAAKPLKGFGGLIRKRLAEAERQYRKGQHTHGQETESTHGDRE